MTGLKQVGAVTAGFVVVAALSTATDFALEAAGIFPPVSEGLFVTWMLALALLYRTVYTALGGYVTGRLAPNRPMRLVVILGLIGFAAATLGAAATWGKGYGPEWYPLALAALAFPSVWIGGRLHQRATPTEPLGVTGTPSGKAPQLT